MIAYLIIGTFILAAIVAIVCYAGAQSDPNDKPDWEAEDILKREG